MAFPYTSKLLVQDANIGYGRRSGQPKSPMERAVEQPSVALDCGQLLLGGLRTKMTERYGSNSIAAIAKRFNIMDRNNDNRLSPYEVHKGLKQIGISVDEKGCILLLNAIDQDGSGCIGYDEFLIALRGPVSRARKKMIADAWRIFAGGNAQVQMEHMLARYDVSWNPDVQSGRKSPEEAMSEFMNIWDRNQDGNITQKEFNQYYKNVSASIDRDDYFELMMRNAWHISGGSGQSANTANKRVRVTFEDGTTEVVEIQNDLNLDLTDIRQVKRRLYEQKIFHVAKISLNAGFEM